MYLQRFIDLHVLYLGNNSWYSEALEIKSDEIIIPGFHPVVAAFLVE
jgi:hypothetical protein